MWINTKKNMQKTSKIVIYLSGITLLIFQIRGALKSFMTKQTNFSISKKNVENLALPTIILCPEIPDLKIVTPRENPMAQNKTAFFEQFYQLGQQFNLTAVKNPKHLGESGQKLFVGNNFDNDGNLMFVIEELMNPGIGICYALSPDNENVQFSNGDLLYINAQFRNKINSVSLYFTSPENKHGMVFYDLGKQEVKKHVVTTGKLVRYTLRKLKVLHMQSTQTCRDYTKRGGSFMDCMIDSQINCFLNENNSNCRCIPAQSKTQFDIMNITLRFCENKEDFFCAFRKLNACYFKKATNDMCLKACTFNKYIASQMDGEKFEEETNKNIIHFMVSYNTMDLRLYQEYYIYDAFSFIGNVGGSLGLFIGFSYTDFLGKILDFVFKKW